MKKFSKLAAILAVCAFIFGGLLVSCSPHGSGLGLDDVQPSGGGAGGGSGGAGGGSGNSGDGGGSGGGEPPAPGPTEKVVDLSTVTADTTVADGYTITGTLANNVKISIADGATVTLKNASINADGTWTSGDYAGLNCLGDATITLEAGTTNTVKGFKMTYPGIHVPSGKILTINGTGALTVSPNTSGAGQSATGAGIGGGVGLPCGNIVIAGGTITASTVNDAAAIGSGGSGGGSDQTCGNISITGGTVTATCSAQHGPGIGAGRRGSCGDISITGGTVTATGASEGSCGAGIGCGGGNSTVGTITIANTVTKVTATGGVNSNGTWKAMSIGKGYNSTSTCVCGTITIGGTVHADGISESPYTYEPNPSPEPGPGPEATEPLTLEFIDAGKITFTNKPASLKYSLDGGATWRAASDSITVSAGDKVGLYANGTGTTSVSNAFIISCDADCYVYGNVMSLEKLSGFSTLVTLEGHNYAFYCLFYGNTHIKNHETKALQLPATTLSQYCYANMFLECTSLTKAPALPATTLVDSCYNDMFSGCTALTSAPELKAETLANYCYASMFYNCTSLTEAPNLPATELKEGCYANMFQLCNGLTSAPSQLPASTLAKSCYKSMFSSCKNLVTAPTLPATILVDNCYQFMFKDCEVLTSITCLATDIYATSCIGSWVTGVLSNGKFICDSSMVGTWIDKRGDPDGVPAGWTVEAQQ